MSLLPDVVPPDDRLPTRHLARAVRAQQRTELAVFNHALRSFELAEKDRIDSQALGTAITGSCDDEMDFLDHGLRRANGSAAKAEIVARKIAMYSSINNRRIERRFGV